MNTRIISIFLLSALLAHKVYATETGAIKGKVTEGATKQPVAGASVQVKGKLLGSFTDSSGVFSIKDVPEGSFSLIISEIGYQRKTLNDVVVVRNKTRYLETELMENVIPIGEVVVTSSDYENDPSIPVSSYSFSREEIFRNPGSQGDIFRAIGILPGVSSGGAQYSAIAVRGQGTADNVYMVDDMPMFELSHLAIEGFSGGFDDPNGGRFSLFAPRVIDNAQFDGGGFAAQYGRKSSSFLGLGIKEGNRETPWTSGQFDLLGFTIIHDGPADFLGNTSVFASARYQNFSLLEKLVGLTSAGAPSYGDYMIKTTTEIDSRNKLSVVAMFNPEKFRRNVNDVRSSGNLNDDNHTTFVGTSDADKGIIGLNLRTLTGSNSYWKNVLYYRVSDVDNLLGNSSPAVNSNGNIIVTSDIPYEQDLRHLKDDQRELGYRSIFTQEFAGGSFTIGTDVARVELDFLRQLKHTDTLFTFYSTDIRPDPSQYYLILQPDQFNSTFHQSAYNASGYTDLSLTLFKRITLNPGVRYDHTGFSEVNTVSPRLSGSIAFNEQQSMNFATGIYYQDPGYADIAGQPSGSRLKSERVTQYILGARDFFSPDVRFVAEGWYKHFDDLIVREKSGQGLLQNSGTGYAFGADVNLIKRLTEKYYGQIGYSYMASKRDDHDGLGLYDFTFSQPHIISLLASYKPNDVWAFSGKFRYATGRPRDRYRIHPDVFGNTAYLRYSAEVTGKNADRYADFISLDLRSDYRVQMGATAITAFVDVVDVLNRFNQDSGILQPLTGKVYYLGLAVFPSFGLSVEF